MSVSVQPCVNPHMVVNVCTQLVVTYVPRRGGGGGTPYSSSALTYGGGDECVHVSTEGKRERKWGRVRKWGKKRREGHRERNVQLVPVAAVSTDSAVWSLVTRISGGKLWARVIEYSALMIHTHVCLRDAVSIKY